MLVMAEQSPKMKVLLAITKSNFGGAQRYVFDLARHLSSTGHEVAVAHGGNGVLAEKLKRVGVRTIPIPELDRDVNILRDIASLRAIIHILKKERPDVLHLNSSKMGLLGALAGRLTEVPRIVFTAHGWPFNEDRSLIQRAAFRMLAMLTIILSHHTIAVSRALADALVPRAQRKVTVIHNGVAPERYLEKQLARSALVPSYTKDEFWFGTIAELHPIKGLSYAIDAFQQHVRKSPSARYIIIGDGEDRAKLQALIEHSGAGDRIHLVGFRDNAVQFLRAFDVFVLPSLSEGLSYAILDAGTAETPVIASRVGGVPEIIKNDESGILVPPRDTEQLARAFERVENDSPLREAFAKTLHAQVTKNFSQKAMLEKTVKEYSL